MSAGVECDVVTSVVVPCSDFVTAAESCFDMSTVKILPRRFLYDPRCRDSCAVRVEFAARRGAVAIGPCECVEGCVIEFPVASDATIKNAFV